MIIRLMRHCAPAHLNRVSTYLFRLCFVCFVYCIASTRECWYMITPQKDTRRTPFRQLCIQKFTLKVHVRAHGCKEYVSSDQFYVPINVHTIDLVYTYVHTRTECFSLDILYIFLACASCLATQI